MKMRINSPPFLRRGVPTLWVGTGWFKGYKTTKVLRIMGFKRCKLNCHALYLILIMMFPFSIQATTWIVQPEAGGHFVRIQDAIDGSSQGDTILVEPGTYYENINFNGKNVVLTSRYLYTEDENDINTTIIDGNRDGRVVTIESGENRSCQLIGFIITHGLLNSGPYDYNSTRYGAGLFIQESSPRIVHAIIRDNQISGMTGGGGVAVKDNSSPFFSKVSIYNNNSGFTGGGLVVFNTSTPEFDSINKCSIYNNISGAQNDIWLNENYPNEISIPLDTFSLSEANEHFIGLPPTLNLTAEHAYFEPIANDLYVSPGGDDNNSGLSFNSPLKTIQYALSIIESDSLNPHTIYLDEGVFSPSGGQHFPLNAKSFINIQGAGKDLTILDGENLATHIFARYDNHYTVSSLGLTRAPYLGPARSIKLCENIGAEYSNIRFWNNSGGSLILGQISTESPPHPQTDFVTLDSLEIINNSCLRNIYFSGHSKIVLKNSIIRNTIPVYDEIWETFMGQPLFATSNSPETNSLVLQNVEITQNNNPTPWYDSFSAVSVNNISTALINCTIGDNESQYGAALVMYDADVTVVNSILYGNSPTQILLDNLYGNSRNTLTVQNSLIEGGQWNVMGMGANTLNWLEGNIDEDPLFQGGDVNPYYLTANSPAIDAGTDFFVWEGDTLLNLSPDDYRGLAPDIGAYEYDETNDVVEMVVPTSFKLYGNYPNPFNGVTHLSFYVPQAGDVKLTVYNIQGQEIEKKVLTYLSSGSQTIAWDAKDLPSGLYIYRFTYLGVSFYGKALLVK